MKEWLRRAVRTFWQAMAGYASANLIIGCDATPDGDVKSVLLGFAAAAVAAGFAAVMNMERK